MGIYKDQLKDALVGHPYKYVEYRGDPRSPVWVIGEAPGADEETYGLPFVGASGKELDRMLSDAGFSPQDVCFTNPYKVRPPDNDISRLGELPIPGLKDLCEKQFFEELNEYKPTICITAGSTSTGLLCPETLSKKTGETSISKWRGSILSSQKLSNWPCYVVASYHPAFILREWAERQVTVLCLAKAREEFDFFQKNRRLNPLPERQIIVQPGFADCIDFLRELLAKPGAVSVDIETISGKYPYTIALAPSPWLGMSFSFWDYEPEQLAQIWRYLDQVLRTKKQIGQNYLGFDACHLEQLGLRPRSDIVSDTLVRHHILWPEFEHKLQFQTFQYTREPYYKDEGKLWRPKEGKPKLMRYNVKDACVTFEIHDCQDEELKERNLTAFYEDYQKKLYDRFHWIEKRGIATDSVALEDLRVFVDGELGKRCAELSTIATRPVSTDKPACMRLAQTLNCSPSDIVNLSAPKQVIKLLKQTGHTIPKKRGTNKESSDAETLNAIHSATGSPVAKAMIEVRELNKIKSTYINAKLADGIFYCSYVVTGTVTGRRSSRATVFGLGGNHQNLPKHSVLGKKFRRCLVARPGHIFVSCDQEQAEDWVVQAIIADVSGTTFGLDELRRHVDRHQKLGAFIFSKPESECGKDTMYRFLGKKTRHAANYDMHAPRMSDALMAEGYSIPTSVCVDLLEKFHQFDPTIRGVFHEYVKQELTKTRTLRTPFGRERNFFSLRPFSNNEKIFKEGYAYIPQSTVGDNTGYAIIYIEDNYPNHIILETHDAITLEVRDDPDTIFEAARMLRKGFDRTLTFPHGLEIQIPVEVEVGYNLQDVKKLCDNCSAIGLQSILDSLRSSQRVQTITTSGVPQQSLAQA